MTAIFIDDERFPTDPSNIPDGELQPFAMALPEKFQARGVFDQTKAYQAYLCEKFQEWACRARPIKVEYTHRDKPEWLK